MLKKADIIAVVLLCVFALAAALMISLSTEKGGIVVIRYNNKIHKELLISKDAIVDIADESGDIVNSIDIRGDTVRMQHASCPDKLCIKQGSIKNSYETIVCLPNLVVIEIRGEGEAEIDAVTR